MITFTKDLADARSRWAQAARSLSRTPGVLLDVGGGSPFQGQVKPTDLGSETVYVCMDISMQARPHVVGDALALPFADNSVSAILCDAVLEHVSDPQTVVGELYRVLKPGGCLHVGVPFIYPYHDAVDYYRFSETGLRHLFRGFADVSLIAFGDYFYAALAFLLGFRLDLVQAVSPIARPFRWALIRLFAGLEDDTARQGAGRRYRRGFFGSPIGWFLFCSKPA